MFMKKRKTLQLQRESLHILQADAQLHTFARSFIFSSLIIQEVNYKYPICLLLNFISSNWCILSIFIISLINLYLKLKNLVPCCRKNLHNFFLKFQLNPDAEASGKKCKHSISWKASLNRMYILYPCGLNADIIASLGAGFELKQDLPSFSRRGVQGPTTSRVYGSLLKRQNLGIYLSEQLNQNLHFIAIYMHADLLRS